MITTAMVYITPLFHKNMEITVTRQLYTFFYSKESHFLVRVCFLPTLRSPVFPEFQDSGGFALIAHIREKGTPRGEVKSDLI